jgi:hypothetical protein
MGFLDVLFGCSHKKLSFPITVRGARRRSSQAASVTGTYVVCLDCGHEFPYDWNQMKVVSRSAGNSPSPHIATEPRRVA